MLDERMLEAKTALNKAKIGLMSTADTAFFSHICFSLIHKFTDDPRMPTAGTDGVCVYYNVKFFLELTPPQRIFLMLHETLHVAFQHMLRGEFFDHQQFNRAADYVINLLAVKLGFQMPPGGLLDYQYDGMSTEQVYKLLDALPTPLPSQCGAGSDGPGDFGSDLLPPSESATKEEKKAAKEALDDILVRAAIHSKAAGDKPGTIPGDIQIYLDNMLNPKLPWQRILSKYMNALNKSDYSLRRPNRRFFPEHHLPSLHSERLEEIAVAFDASLSVSDAEFQQNVSEVYAILKRFKPKKITLLCFDTQVRSEHTVKSAQDLLNQTFTGRGGTKIEPVLEWAEERKPTLLLVFSDGWFEIPEKGPKKPIVWLVYDNKGFAPTFGKTIHYSMKK